MHVGHFSPRFYKIITPCLLICFFYLFTCLIIGFSVPHLGLRKTIFPSLLLSFGLFYATQKKYLYLLSPFLLSLSIYTIFLFSKEAISSWDIYSAIGFHTALFLLCIIPGLFISSPKWKKIYFFITLYTYLLPTLLLWAYFSISHSWPVPDTIIAILQTNSIEACGYIASHISWLAAPICLLYSVGIYLLVSKIPFSNKKPNLCNCLLSGCLALAASTLAMISLENPLFFLIYDSNVQIQQYQEFKELQTARHSFPPPAISSQPADGIFVLVIGESQNRNHMRAYGYDRDTTPWLFSKEEDPHFIRFARPYSCYVQTVQVLSYALTSKNQYNAIPLEQAITLVDAAKAAGYETYWISNQTRYGVWDSPTTVIATGCDHQFWVNQTIGDSGLTNFYDEKVVDFVSQLRTAKKAFVIIHLMGNHRPYLLRYPSNYAIYHGDNKSMDYYDNSMRYNDEVMKQLYETLRNNDNFRAMVYCADHGEGIDEGLDHDVTTYRPSMTHIPFYMAFSESYMQSYPETLSALRSHQDDIFTNDLLFNTMLGLMHVNLEGLYEPENDITSDSYDTTPGRFRTLFGKKALE